MKKNTAIIMTGTSISIALISIASALSIANKYKAELTTLRNQIGRMQAYIPEADTAPLIVFKTLEGDTHTLAQLEAEVTQLDTELITAKENTPPPRESWSDRMARLKEEDPEAYAKKIEKRAKRQETMRYDLAERTANFINLDSTSMTDAEYENHDLLIEKMTAIWAMTEQFNNPEEPTDREAMHALSDAIKEARPLMKTERTTMFRQLAGDLGLSGAESSDFSGYIEDIISTTTIKSPRGNKKRR